MTPIILDSASLTIEQVITVAYGQPGAPRVELSIEAKAKAPFRRIL